jgi:hypothetical protein
MRRSMLERTRVVVWCALSALGEFLGDDSEVEVRLLQWYPQDEEAQ